MNLNSLAYPQTRWEKQMVVFNPTVSTKVKYHGNIKMVFDITTIGYLNYYFNLFDRFSIRFKYKRRNEGY